MHKSNLIIKIISNTHYEAELIQLLIANEKYKSLDVVPFPELITNLENLILVGQKTVSIEVNSAKNAPRPPSPPRPRSVNPSKGQEACDICLSYEFDPRWCRQQDHCRVAGHQPSTNRSQTRERQIRSGDLSCFVLRKNCNICNPGVMNVTAPPPPHFPPPPPWNFPPPRPSNHRQSSKSPSRAPDNRR